MVDFHSPHHIHTYVYAVIFKGFHFAYGNLEMIFIFHFQGLCMYLLLSYGVYPYKEQVHILISKNKALKILFHAGLSGYNRNL